MEISDWLTIITSSVAWISLEIWTTSSDVIFTLYESSASVVERQRFTGTEGSLETDLFGLRKYDHVDSQCNRLKLEWYCSFIESTQLVCQVHQCSRVWRPVQWVVQYSNAELSELFLHQLEQSVGLIDHFIQGSQTMQSVSQSILPNHFDESCYSLQENEIALEVIEFLL